jgi:hypothetical protein
LFFGSLALAASAFCNMTSPESLTAKLILQPGFKSSASLICFGMVTWPLMVKVVVIETLFLLLIQSNTLALCLGKVNELKFIERV